MEETQNSGNGKNLKKLCLKRITPADLTGFQPAGARNVELLYGPIYWVNPYLLFLILILLLLSFSPSAWVGYALEME